MIQVVRNKKSNRVVALCVNGKHFSVSKELANAIGLEEESNLKKTRDLTLKTSELAKQLLSKAYVVEVGSMRLKAFLTEENELVSHKMVIEFKSEIEYESKKKVLEILEDFIIAINQVQIQKIQDTKELMKKIELGDLLKTA